MSSPTRRHASPSADDTNPRANKKARTLPASNDAITDPEATTAAPTNGTAPTPDSLISVPQALAYWTSTNADVNGMLGGLPQVSRVDLQQSANFLAKLRRQSSTHAPSKQLARVVDCGAGIGRITLGFLSKVAQVVDIVEPVPKFSVKITEGNEFIGVRERGGIGRVWNCGLEDWDPEGEAAEGDKVERYDVIWNQWCLGYLNDERLSKYMARIKGLVTEGGWIVVKENLSTDPNQADIYDEEDSSVTRSDDKLRSIFKQAGLKIVSTEIQKGFPKSLYPVRLYALQV